MSKIAIEKFLKHRWIISFFLVISFFIFILPINETIAFAPNSSLDHKSLIVENLLKLLFAFVLFFIFNFFLKFIEKIRSKDQFYITWLRISAVYLLFMMVFFILIYPGHWVHDEFIVLNSVKNYSLFAWQNYFTNIYYTFCLYIIPTGVGIVLLQNIFISLVIGYIIGGLKEVFKNKKLWYFLFLPFILFPIVINNLYPLRLTIYSYIELLFIGRLILLHFKVIKINNPYLELFINSALITIIVFWRSEAFYYLLLLPFIVIQLGIFNKQSIKKLTTYCKIIPAIIVILTGYAINQYTSNPDYNLPVLATPLSTMVQKPLKGKNIQQDLNVIDQTLDLSVLKEHPSCEESPLWYGAKRPTAPINRSALYKSFIYVVANNPASFIKNRTCTFLADNSFTSTNNLPIVGLYDNVKSIDAMNASSEFMYFTETNYASTPISQNIRNIFTKILLMVDGNGKMTPLGHVLWNSIPAILLIILSLIYCIVNRKKFWIFIICLILARVIMLFLTSPARYFMYYLPVYMNGYFVVMVLLLKYIDGKLKHHETIKRQ